MTVAPQMSIPGPSAAHDGVENAQSAWNPRKLGTMRPPPPPARVATRTMLQGEERRAEFGWERTVSTPKVVMPTVREKPSTRQKGTSRT